MKNTKLNTGMYIIDKDYRMISFNKVVTNLYDVEVGDYCYKKLAFLDAPCEICPLKENNSLFFNRKRKEWIYSNAAEIDLPNNEKGYSIHFQLRERYSDVMDTPIIKEEVGHYVAELQEITGSDCAIGAYCEPGSPLFYANEKMIKLLGYETYEELFETINGLVVNTVHPDDRSRVKKDMGDPYLIGNTYETIYRMICKDGSWIWTINKGKVIMTESGKKAIISVCSDMSEFIKWQEELRLQNISLNTKNTTSRFMLHHIPGGFHRCAAEDGFPFIYISHSFEDVVGWTREEIKEIFDNKFINLVWEEDFGVFQGLVKEIDEKNTGSVVYRMKKKGGGFRWVQDSTMFIEVDGQKFYQCTLSDVSEYIEKIENAKDKAEEGSKAKSTFLFNVSHDIRTPMNAILGYANIIEQNIENYEYVKDSIDKIKISGNTLMNLLNDVLELSRIESGKDKLELAPCSLCEIGQNLYQMFKEEMDKKGVMLIPEPGVDNCHVLCDELKVTRIFMNMLSNAKKFTPTGGTVRFGIDQLPTDDPKIGKFQFFVKDTGIGMSKEFLEKAFDQFERERTATDSGTSGSGLGLSIIKRLVDLMKGSCRIESELGQGTNITVTLEFPLLNDEECETNVNKFIDVNFDNKRILLVEDNDFNREITKYILESLNILVEEAINGQDAYDKVLSSSDGHYDLILMDIQMPLMNGYQATEKIRNIKNLYLSNIPIIAMTANAFSEDKAKCIACGMNAHISKPIDLNELKRVLIQYLKLNS